MKKKNFFIVFLVLFSLLITSCDLLFPADDGVTVDKSILVAAIGNANTLLEGTTVGSDVGNVPADAASTYDDAITAAEGVNADSGVTQTDVNAAVTTLATATVAFNDAIITQQSLEDSELASAKAELTAALATADALGGSVGTSFVVGGVSITDSANFSIARGDVVALLADDRPTAPTLQELNDAIVALATATEVFEAARYTQFDIDLFNFEADLTLAQALHDAAVEGTASGEYGVGSKEAFQTALDAVIVSKDAATTIADIDAAKVALNTAIADFKATISYVFTTIYNFDEDPAPALSDAGTGSTPTIVADPVDGANKVLSVLKETTDPAWALVVVSSGYSSSCPAIIQGSTAVFELKLYSPAVDQKFTLKLEKIGGGAQEAVAYSTVANQWETLRFDFETLNDEYNKLVLIPNHDGVMTVDETYYIDDVKYSGSLGDVIPEPDAPSLAMPYGIFSETVSGLDLATSGGTGIWTNNGMVLDTQDTAMVAEGTEAMSFTYGTATGGGGGFVYFSDTQNESEKSATSLTDATNLVFTLHSTTALTALEIKIESVGGNASVDLLSYTPVIDGDWSTYTIPLADFETVGFAEVTVPFSMWHPNGYDGGYTGTIYIDNVYYQ